MSLHELLWNNIEDGEKGLNEGLPFSIKRLSRYLLLRKKWYYLIFAQSGVGKSALMYDQFIYHPLRLLLAKETTKDISWLFWNLEITNSDFIGIMTCKWLHDEYKLLIDKDYLYAVNKKKKLNDKVKTALDTLEFRAFIDALDKRMRIYTWGNSSSIRNGIDEYMKDRGIVKEGKRNKYYIPENKNEMVILLNDHIGLCKKSKGELNEWQVEVNVSSAFKEARNLYYTTAVVVQQVNPEKQTYKDKDRVMPDIEHLRGGKETFQDCDTAIALGNPFKFRVDKYHDYKILPTSNNEGEGLENRLRILELRKNRGFMPNFLPTLFIGETGQFKDISNPDKIDYKRIQKIQKITT